MADDTLAFLFGLAVCLVVGFLIGRNLGKAKVKDSHGINTESVKHAREVVMTAVELLPLASKIYEKGKIIREYAKVLGRPAMFRQESELPFPKAVIRRALAAGLLREDLDENMRNRLAVGFTQLEYFVSKNDFDIVNPFCELIQDKNNIELAERARRGEDVLVELRRLAKKVSTVPDFWPVWNEVSKREMERGYQLQVLRSIASGETDLDMTRLMVEYDKEVGEAVSRLQERWGIQTPTQTGTSKDVASESVNHEQAVKWVEDFFKLKGN